MSTYETIFITPPTLAEDEEKAVVQQLATLVTEGGGSLEINDRMGRRRLAYPIEKFEDGVYTRFLYSAEAAVPHELERRVRLSDKVLRSLTVKLTDEWAQWERDQAVKEAARRVEAEKAAAEEAARKEAEEAEAAEKEKAAEASSEGDDETKAEAAPSEQASAEEAGDTEAKAASADETPDKKQGEDA